MEIPKIGEWTFENKEIADNFDKHVREQLPWYDLVSGAVAHICRHYLPENGILYDIGASTGNLSVILSEIIERRNINVVAIEPSMAMIKEYKGKGKIISERAEDHNYINFDVAIMFLTMMFIPVRLRTDLLNKLRRKCNYGGVIIIVDKISDCNGYSSTIMHRLTLAGKIATGTSPNEIIKKELSLCGVQRPINKDLVHDAFQFFRFGEFAGWLIEKNIHS